MKKYLISFSLVLLFSSSLAFAGEAPPSEVVREGTLIVDCDPSGATVILDGEPVGEAPVMVSWVSVMSATPR